MSDLIAGAASGLLMASVFVGVTPIMLFFLAKDPSPFLRSVLDKVPPIAITMALVVLAYPTWSVIGAIIGVLYRVSATEAPGGGIGSPNLAFTLSITVAAVMMAAPLMFLLRRVVLGVAALALTFAGVFGWLLPLLAG